MGLTLATAAGGTAESGSSQQPLLLVTTVDIGEGMSDRIEVRKGDDSMEVARAFVVKHSLPQAIIPRLAMHLEDNLAKVEAQKQALQQVRLVRHGSHAAVRDPMSAGMTWPCTSVRAKQCLPVLCRFLDLGMQIDRPCSCPTAVEAVDRRKAAITRRVSARLNKQQADAQQWQ